MRRAGVRVIDARPIGRTLLTLGLPTVRTARAEGLLSERTER